MANDGALFNKKSMTGNVWSLVLAAGDGTRLQGLLKETYGFSVPKQYCSLYGRSSLLEETLERAARIVPDDRLCTVVASQHRQWWQLPLSTTAKDNVFVQPENRGTANGILWPLLHIIKREPEARIVLLPSDHHIEDEPLLVDSIRQAISQLDVHPEAVHLLGIEPDSPDAELGYIISGQEDGHQSYKVNRFVEKPSLIQAKELVRTGALWNAFIIVANARALLDLFAARVPQVVAEMKSLISSSLHSQSANDSLDNLYAHLPTIDFSKHILQGQEDRLRVVAVPSCGWSDLGTPRRVMSVLQRGSHSYRTSYKELETTPYACLSVASRFAGGTFGMGMYAD
jgi:mannose-1-phosphate guanylyltransferase